jgi:3',5'-cyclic AMP phosphodiesterase CpdA
MITLVHASDVHFGEPFRPSAAEAFLAAVNRLGPDAIVISGDFTQRAKVHEYEAAAGFLKRLPDLPLVVTPGNHDVPVYRVFERLFAPRRNYRRHINDELDTVTRIAGATIVALDSTSPYTAVVNGRIGASQLDFARAAFAASPDGDVRILVAHHNLARAPDYDGDAALPGARRLLKAFVGMGVEVALGGHLHRAYVSDALDVVPREELDVGVVLVQSGTTTSSRGRARERGDNSFNRLRIDEASIEITRFLRVGDRGDFEPFGIYRVPRPGVARLPLDSGL